MTNYKTHPAGASTVPQTKLYEDLAHVVVTSHTDADTYGSYVQFSANIGSSKTIYGVILYSVNPVVDAAGLTFDIAEGAAASEVVKLRYPLTSIKAGTCHYLPCHYAITNSARVAFRCKDGEAVANGYDINLLIGASP